MSDEKDIVAAKQVYKTLCDALDNRNWNYEKNEESLSVHFSVSGDDISMQFIFAVDIDRQLIRVMSPLPYKISDAKRVEGAIATCHASYGLPHGSFDYDISSGAIAFRMAAAFRNSIIAQNFIYHLIDCASVVVDRYNDQFLAIDKGLISINDFITKNTH